MKPCNCNKGMEPWDRCRECGTLRPPKDLKTVGEGAFVCKDQALCSKLRARVE